MQLQNALIQKIPAQNGLSRIRHQIANFIPYVIVSYEKTRLPPTLSSSSRRASWAILRPWQQALFPSPSAMAAILSHESPMWAHTTPPSNPIRPNTAREGHSVSGGSNNERYAQRYGSSRGDGVHGAQPASSITAVKATARARGMQGR
jgi:hypothetical protein